MVDILKLLYGDNNLSKCCSYKVFVQCGGEGSSYYVCKKCNKPCDLKDIKIGENDK